MHRQINNRKELKEKRIDLRKNLTPAEAALWKMIQNSKIDGKKFRRQHSVGNYILDFYCPEERLAIELDGAYHFTSPGSDYDEERTKYLTSVFIRVLRFENKLVFEQSQWVVDEIRRNFNSRTK